MNFHRKDRSLFALGNTTYETALFLVLTKPCASGGLHPIMNSKPHHMAFTKRQGSNRQDVQESELMTLRASLFGYLKLNGSFISRANDY